MLMKKQENAAIFAKRLKLGYKKAPHAIASVATVEVDDNEQEG